MNHEAFLSDVIEHPDDDAPRLVYADWLEDNDDPERAEFIRLQCRLARLPNVHPDRAALEKREAQLLRAHERQWGKGITRYLKDASWCRGFIESVYLPAGDLIEQAERIFARAPIRAVDAGYLQAAILPRVLRQPQLSRLASLEVRGSFRHVGAKQFAGCPRLANLRALSVHDTP